jgi:hypothetical protein
MEKQTAVEYLVEQLLPKALSTEQYYHIEKAKEMEKQQQEQITEESEIHWKTTLVTMTNNEQQTAVEWLFIKLYETIEMKGDGKVMDALLKEAKEMEKEQIIDAIIFSKREHYTLGECWPTQTVIDKAESYYKKTFKND